MKLHFFFFCYLDGVAGTWVVVLDYHEGALCKERWHEGLPFDPFPQQFCKWFTSMCTYGGGTSCKIYSIWEKLGLIVAKTHSGKTIITKLCRENTVLKLEEVGGGTFQNVSHHRNMESRTNQSILKMKMFVLTYIFDRRYYVLLITTKFYSDLSC